MGAVQLPDALQRAIERQVAARLIRLDMESAQRVRSPRHFIVYRVASDGIVDILGMVHDRMVLSRAARKAVRAAEAQ